MPAFKKKVTGMTEGMPEDFPIGTTTMGDMASILTAVFIMIMKDPCMWILTNHHLVQLWIQRQVYLHAILPAMMHATQPVTRRAIRHVILHATQLVTPPAILLV